MRLPSNFYRGIRNFLHLTESYRTTFITQVMDKSYHEQLQIFDWSMVTIVGCNLIEQVVKPSMFTYEPQGLGW